MFRTMDGVQVYDKADVDTVIQETKEELNASKAERSEIHELVQTAASTIIGEKVNEVAGTFENTINDKVAAAVTAEDIPGKIDTALAGYDTGAQVSNKIDTALAGYDNSDAVDTKISTAIGNIPAGPSAMTTSEATAIVNTYF